MALGTKIRELRDDLGISQAQLASEGGLSQGYLSQLENDEVQNPSASVIFRLAKALHVDPRVLMQAAGYGGTEADANGGPEFEVAVDPDLLRFLAGLTTDEQTHLLALLKGMESRGTAGWLKSEPATGPAGKPELQESLGRRL
jgi:transcriptional regulator with XRE-family HTH domain